MGRIFLIIRLAARDLRHRPGPAALLLIAITAATTTLALGLALRGVSDQPYQQTRAATSGPDVVAAAGSQAPLDRLTRADGVTAHSGPYPYTYATLTIDGRTAGAQVEGRDQTAAAVDQPAITQGGWVRSGQVVLERSFAEELGVTTGDTVRLDGRAFRVAGVAVSAATTLLNPHICYAACRLSTAELARKVPGLIWATRADATSLATQAVPVSYTVNLKLANPANAPAFAAAQNESLDSVQSWQDLSFNASDVVRNEQRALTTGSLLLGLLAIASVAVLVGGRMADQTRRVGLLKAVGSSPGLIAAILLAEHLAVAAAAAALGLLAGWLAAPLLTDPGAGLLGSPGAPAINITTIGVVIAVALGVAMVATVVPALRATRISTVRALADAARTPRRHGFLTRVSSRLPAPLLLGVRLSARRPRRTLLSVASTAVAASGIVAVICVHAAGGAQKFAGAGLADPQTGQLNRVLLVLSAGLAVAQGGLALIGGLLGVPGGIGLFGLVNKSGESGTPSALAMTAVVLGSVVAVAAVTYIPAWLGTRPSPARVLAMEAV
jgi:putative ABC transport system permease protein